MKKSILELKGVQLLSKEEQKTVNGAAWQTCCKDRYGHYPGCRCDHH